MKRVYTIKKGSLKMIRILIRNTLFWLLILILNGCGTVQKEVTKDRVSKQKTMDTLLTDGLIEKEANFDISKLYGNWVVDDVAFRDITEVTKDGRGINPYWYENLVGSMIEYKENSIKLNNIFYEVKACNQELDYFDDIMKRLNLLDTVHLDFMENHHLEKMKCYFLSYETESNDPKIGAHFIVLNENHILFFAGGCYFNGYRVDLNNVQSCELPTPPMPPDPKYLYGKWVIQCALTEDNSLEEQYKGYTLEYQQDYIVLGDMVYNTPLYSYDVPLPVSEFCNWFQDIDSSCTKNVEYMYTQYIFLNGVHLDAIGTYLFYLDENNILILHDNIFYQAKKEYHTNLKVEKTDICNRSREPVRTEYTDSMGNSTDT